MKNLRITLVFFSATDVTKTIAGIIEEELKRLGCEVRSIDITPFASRTEEDLKTDGAAGFLFGFPVFGGFAPSVINEWLPILSGNNTRCATFFTYGGRTAGNAHYHTKLLLEKAGFKVQFSAEFLGRHSFNVAGWTALPDRPNESDFLVARKFAGLAVDRFTRDSENEFLLPKPSSYDSDLESGKGKQKSTERGWRNPVRTVEECSMCRRCEDECPNQAFSADSGLSDPLKCIECMHCVYHCPDKVLKLHDMVKDSYQSFLQKCHLSDRIMSAKQSIIFT